MGTENPAWGYSRIQGALKNLDHRVSRSTVAKVLKDNGVPPAPGRPSSWRTLLRAHWGEIAVCRSSTSCGTSPVIAFGMTRQARELESKVLKLPSRDRARLAQRLISSLDEEADANAEKLWLEEAERRLAELKSRKVAGIPADKVMKRARSALP